MKLASIVPVKDVAHTFDGDYAMLLAHLKDYYPKKHDPKCYVIMDNSLVELGGAVGVETVYNAAKQCGADEFILPDVYQNMYGTIQEVTKSLKWLHRTKHIGEMRLMAVCQGATIEEFTHCFRVLEQLPDIHCIGIPKVAAKLLPEGRPGLEYLWRGSSKAIHLLGCWTNLDEFERYKHPTRIRSCDTCIPALLSTHHIHDAWCDRPEKTIDLINDRIDEWAYEDIIRQLAEVGLI
jgi:hypothetical protein